jgi:hypothetical protein
MYTIFSISFLTTLVLHVSGAFASIIRSTAAAYSHRFCICGKQRFWYQVVWKFILHGFVCPRFSKSRVIFLCWCVCVCHWVCFGIAWSWCVVSLQIVFVLYLCTEPQTSKRFFLIPRPLKMERIECSETSASFLFHTAYEDGTYSVPQHQYIKFRCRGITWNKGYNIYTVLVSLNFVNNVLGTDYIVATDSNLDWRTWMMLVV